MTPNLQKTWLAALAVSSLSALSQANAATITVLNPSFEISPANSGHHVPDWTENDPSITYSQARGPADYFVHATDQDYVLEVEPNASPAVSTAFVTQTISFASYTPAVGDVITLTLDALQETGGSGPGNIIGAAALTFGGSAVAFNLTNGTSVQTADPSNPSGPYYSFNEITASFTVTSAELGQQLGIELLGPTLNTTFAFDNVQLSYTPGEIATPEPSTWALMFAGLLSLVGLRRYARRA